MLYYYSTSVAIVFIIYIVFKIFKKEDSEEDFLFRKGTEDKDMFHENLKEIFVEDQEEEEKSMKKISKEKIDELSEIYR